MEQTIEKEEKGLSLDDALEAAYATQKEEFEPQEETKEPVEKSKESDLPDTEDKGDEKDDAEQVQEKGRKAEVKPPVDTLEEPQQVDSPQVEAPPFWNKQEKEVFAKLPLTAKKIVTQKAKEGQAYVDKVINRLNQEFHQQVGDWRGLNEVFTEDRIKQIRSTGLTPAAVVERYFGWQDALNANPAATIVHLAETYGVTPQNIIDYVQSGAPQEIQTNQTIEELRTELETLKAQQQKQFSDQEVTQVRAQIDAFGAEKGEDGSPLRPFFSELKPVIRQLLPLIYQQNEGISDYDALHMAWERAAYAEPQIREKLLSQNKARDVQAKKQEIQKTKKAGSSLVGTTSSPGTPRTKAKTVDEALTMALEAQGVNL